MSDAELMADQFHATLGHERGRGNAALRLKFHEEEHQELEAELGDEDIDPTDPWRPKRDEDVDRAALARELADVVYIAYGTAHAFDIDLDVAVAEVHRATMTKLKPVCAACSGDGQTVVTYDDELDDDEYEQCEQCEGSGIGEPVVREDGKILKPPGFVPPDMTGAVR